MNDKQKAVAKIIKGLTAYFIASLISVVGCLVLFLVLAVFFLASSNLFGSPSQGYAVALVSIAIIAAAAYIYGFITYSSGLNRLAFLLEGRASSALRSMAWSKIISLVTLPLYLGLFPLMDSPDDAVILFYFIGLSLALIASFIFSARGYLALCNSDVFVGEVAQRGAKTLRCSVKFNTALVSVISTFALLLPLIVLVFGGIPTENAIVNTLLVFCVIAMVVLNIFYRINLLDGWRDIRASFKDEIL